MTLTKNLERNTFYLNFYRALNSVLNLSKKELLILSHFATMRSNLPKELTSIQSDAMTFSAANRKIVAETLGISIFNLNNYIKALKDKKILVLNDKGKISIYHSIYVDIDNTKFPYSLEFKFNLV